jgi:REP element-mobilizing transposase RayT
MATYPRDARPGLHHIWVNATGGERYYVDEIDRLAWLRELVATLETFDWTCVAFCQLTTHVHLLVNVPDESLPFGMRRLNFEYSRRFNRRHDRPGQFVRRRYGNRAIRSAADLVGAFGYVVVRNPTKAGVSDRPEDWRWSSLATTLGITEDYLFVDASLVLAEFGGSRERLRAFVGEQHRACLAEPATSSRQTTGRGAFGRVRP